MFSAVIICIMDFLDFSLYSMSVIRINLNALDTALMLFLHDVFKFMSLS